MSVSIGSILSNAATGLAASQASIAAISDNIANAGIAGFTAKTLTTSTFDAGGQSSGVRTGLVTRSVDAALQASVWSSASSVGALTVRSQVLNAVNATQGVPGDGTSLADAMQALQSSFTVLQSQPSSQSEQTAVVAAASTLASTINATANTITSERNGVQTQIVASVATLNAAMDTVQSTTAAIVSATASHSSTADLEDQRDTALQSLSGLLALHFDKQANGGITILGANGLSIPLTSRFSTDPAVLSPSSAYVPGSTSVPPILMQSANASSAATDVTGLLTGGQLGELISLRDTTLPANTASLDTFAATLSGRLGAQGLQLFTDGSGTAPTASYAGLSSQIQVNPAVSATPSLVRDGTSGTANASGVAGFTGIIDAVVNTGFAPGFLTPSLASSAQSFVSQQSAATGNATTGLTDATSYQTTVASRFSDGSGVNVDQEMGLMIQLQNSYQANARVITTAQAMFTALVNAFTAV